MCDRDLRCLGPCRLASRAVYVSTDDLCAVMLSFCLMWVGAVLKVNRARRRASLTSKHSFTWVTSPPFP